MVGHTQEQVISALQTVTESGVPDAVAARILDVGTENYLNFFKQEIIDGILRAGGATCCFYEGAYGAGKTHLLQLLRWQAEQCGVLTAEIELSRDMDFSNWNAVTQRILESLQLATPNGHIKSLPRVLDYLADNQKPELFFLKRYLLPHVGFVNAMEIYLKKNHRLHTTVKRKLADFLLGQKITVKTLRQFGIERVKNPLSKRNAEVVFKTVLSALFHLGLPTIILFDEIDQSFQNTRKVSNKARNAANLVRRLIDACSLSNLKGICIVFAVSLNFIPRCNEVYPALGERVAIHRCFLEKPNWRIPLNELESVNEFQDQEAFAETTVEKFVGLARELKIDDKIDRGSLQDIARKCLLENVGSGFRRPLIRRLAAELLQALP